MSTPEQAPLTPAQEFQANLQDLENGMLTTARRNEIHDTLSAIIFGAIKDELDYVLPLDQGVHALHSHISGSIDRMDIVSAAQPRQRLMGLRDMLGAAIVLLPPKVDEVSYEILRELSDDPELPSYATSGTYQDSEARKASTVAAMELEYHGLVYPSQNDEGHFVFKTSTLGQTAMENFIRLQGQSRAPRAN